MIRGQKVWFIFVHLHSYMRNRRAESMQLFSDYFGGSEGQQSLIGRAARGARISTVSQARA